MPYRYTFTSQDNYDEYGNWSGTTYYKSDNNGGYYTE